MKQELIGDKGRRDLELVLGTCGIKAGFERGFVGLVLERAVADLADLTEEEDELVRADARWLAEYESLARQQVADREATHISNADMIAEGSKWLGL